jgi:O-antigen/teichoic acid export membrane protein
VSLTYGLAAASIPRVSPLVEHGERAQAKREVAKAIAITLFISIPCSIALAVFAPFAVNVIFRSLSLSDQNVIVLLVRIMAVNAVTLSLIQTTCACLTALGKPIFGTITSWTSGILRVVICAVLIKFTSLSIYGAAISANCSYLVAIILNFCYIMYVQNKAERK